MAAASDNLPRAQPRPQASSAKAHAGKAQAPAAPRAKVAAGKPARPAQPTPPGPAYAERQDAMRLADEIAARQSLDPESVRRAIAQARYLPWVPRLVLPAAAGTAKNWRVYRSRFVEPVRIRAGVRFWEQHRTALARAQAEYGVPADIIVGIIGVETLYGQQTGNVRILDALATLAFDFPEAHPRAAERQAFFRGELEQYLVLLQRGSVAGDTRGSYAGAMGLPQFMPSSWARWAVDFDGDGRIDLFGSPEDAIGSVASYFRAFGWRTGMPATYPVTFDTARLDLPALLAPDIKPTFSAAELAARGAMLEAGAAAHSGPLALVELQNGEEPPSYVAGTENFWVVTRYNWSSYYAMAVLELGAAVAEARQAGQRP